ncbi:hypothetical protein [Pannonibacter sp.]|uniref:hypothetical protein n=1 Tax=Pannonibacter sp. TaxID=1906786 RepID=UPI003F70302F
MSSVFEGQTGAKRRVIAAGPRRREIVVTVLSVALAIAAVGSAGATDTGAADWTLEKCRRYRDAAQEALQRFGSIGLSDEFLSRHRAFLDRDCADPRDVCPRSPQELAFADRLIIRAMNAGTASTFPPFGCRN